MKIFFKPFCKLHLGSRVDDGPIQMFNQTVVFFLINTGIVAECVKVNIIDIFKMNGIVKNLSYLIFLKRNKANIVC